MRDDQNRTKRRGGKWGRGTPQKTSEHFLSDSLVHGFRHGKGKYYLYMWYIYILVRILQYYTGYNITKKIYNYIHEKYDDLVLFQVSEHFMLELMAGLKIQHLTNYCPFNLFKCYIYF